LFDGLDQLVDSTNLAGRRTALVETYEDESPNELLSGVE
jgi:hypothetical protein